MDLGLYTLLNSLAGHSVAFDTLVRWGAAGLHVVIASVLVAAWFWTGQPVARGGRERLVVYALAAAVIALGLAQVIGLLWFRQRPFIAHPAHLLLAHSPDASFPSDHAVAGFAIATPFLLARRHLGWVLLGLALLLGLCRVIAGIHYPGDILGGAALGLLIGTLVWGIRGLVEPGIAWGLAIARRVRLA